MLFGNSDTILPGGYAGEEISPDSPINQVTEFPQELVLLGIKVYGFSTIFLFSFLFFSWSLLLLIICYRCAKSLELVLSRLYIKSSFFIHSFIQSFIYFLSNDLFVYFFIYLFFSVFHCPYREGYSDDKGYC